MSPGARPTAVGVIGAGSWGTALANLLAKAGHRVCLWAFEEEVSTSVREAGENTLYLPEIQLHPELKATHDLAEALSDAEVVLSVSPAQHVARVMGDAGALMRPHVQVVSASKGIETNTLRRMDEVFQSILTSDQMNRFTVLSGPSFAREVAQDQPTAVVVASRSKDARLRAQTLFQTPYFRVYTVPDVTGVELGGALKNVIALAAGVVAGLGFGHNTQAALITRGLAEITRLGTAMGAERATFAGLAGMGDLVLTCTGDESRNRTVGYRLGRGEQLDDILGSMRAVAEGVKTTFAVHDLASRYRVEMPISQQVYAILAGEQSPADAVRLLMTRDPKPEDWS